MQDTATALLPTLELPWFFKKKGFGEVFVFQFWFVRLLSCVTLIQTSMLEILKGSNALLLLLPGYSSASTHSVGFPVSHLWLPCFFLCTLSVICSIGGGHCLAVCVACGSGWHKFNCYSTCKKACSCMFSVIVSIWLQLLLPPVSPLMSNGLKACRDETGC